MKRKTVNLGKKLFLNKLIVSDLSARVQSSIKGGISEIATCKYEMCQNTVVISCRTNCVTIAGATCTPDTICQDTGNTCISCNPGSGCPTQAPLCISN